MAKTSECCSHGPAGRLSWELLELVEDRLSAYAERLRRDKQGGGYKMTASTFDEIGRVLREHQNFAVLSHVRPDGDALGSQLALALSLQKLGKDVRVWNEDGTLEKYSFLPRAELLTKPPVTGLDFDVAIALDTAIQNRLGNTLAAVASAKI